MSGGNRGIIAAAIFGLASTCFGLGAFVALEGSYQPSSYPKYRERAPDQGDGTNKAVADKAIQSPEEKQPCTEPYGRDESDLCAQWQAADAAKKAADWAWWQMIFSGLGVLGIGVTLWFNKRAIDIALGASDDMERSLAIAAQGAEGMQSAAIAMRRVAIVGREQLDHARTSSRMELRAYMFVEKASIQITDEDVFAFVDIKNFGQTPAYHSQAWINIWVECLPLHDPLPQPPHDLEQGVAVVGPGASSEFRHNRTRPLNEFSRKRIEEGTSAIYVHGAISYKDTFGETRTSRYCYFCSGKSALERGRLAPYISGNEAD